MIELSYCRLPPYKHQAVGVSKLVESPYFFLMDEMGAGKTFQVINAALILANRGLINKVIIIAPAAVRSVWFDPELGELSKWLWANFPVRVTEFHSKVVSWNWFTHVDNKQYKPKLEFIVTNYDFVRGKDHREKLIKVCDSKTLLVLDESSAVKNWNSLQTKACEKIRAAVGRVWLLNGTPISNNPGDLYSQAHLMNPAILGCKNFFHFRSRYARMGGWQGRQIVGWHDIDDIQKRLEPYVLRRLKEDCLDLPEKIPSVAIPVTLTNKTWDAYKEMRDDMVLWLNNQDASIVSQAIVKAIRLSQICSGFIGGVERLDHIDEAIPDFIERREEDKLAQEYLVQTTGIAIEVQEIGREKLDVFIDWVKMLLEQDPNLKMLVWSRFRPEVKRTVEELNKVLPQIQTGLIWGSSKKAERDHALRLLDPRTAPTGPVIVVGTPATGSMGLNLTAANRVLYMSNDYSLKVRLQSEDRVHRPGQTRPVSYYDMVACGPKGQKTIEHKIVAVLSAKEQLADLTTSAWLEVLED